VPGGAATSRALVGGLPGSLGRLRRRAGCTELALGACSWILSKVMARTTRRSGLFIALVGVGYLLGACGPSVIVLSSGQVRVTFKGEETCGFDNPYLIDARGCRKLDRNALMCKGFGVIDGVLFAGGCEAPAEAEVLETRGTMPVAPSRGDVPESTGDAKPGVQKP